MCSSGGGDGTGPIAHHGDVVAVWRWLAVGVAGLHYAYLAYLLLGGFIAWRWPWTITTHGLAAFWAVRSITGAVPGQLTWLQNEFRQRAGLPPLTGGFVDTYIKDKLYPADQELAARVIVASLVIASWLGFVLMMRRHRA